MDEHTRSFPYSSKEPETVSRLAEVLAGRRIVDVRVNDRTHVESGWHDLEIALDDGSELLLLAEEFSLLAAIRTKD